MAIEKIAYHLGRRDEVPNQELAAELAGAKDAAGIAEIAAHLDDKNQSIASDCLKVLYETGYIAPELITPHTGKFLALLDEKNNRMVWGAMIALSTIAGLVPGEIIPHRERIMHLIETGTVITNVSGVRTLINLAGAGEPYYSTLIDDLLNLQGSCRNIDFAKRAEEMAAVIKGKHLPEYKEILQTQLPYLSASAQKRLERVIRKIV